MKKLLTAVAASVLFSGAAFADQNVFIGSGGSGGGNDAAKAGYPGAIERGNAAAWTAGADGIPIILPFVSDRTAKRYARKRGFQPGPFHELGADDRVE